MSIEVAIKCYLYNAECKEFLSKIISKFLLYWSEFHRELNLNIHGPYTYSKTWQVRNAENATTLDKIKIELGMKIKTLREIVQSWSFGEERFSFCSQDSNQITKYGYLLKKYNQLIGPATWQRRFFVLENGHIYYYFLPDSDRSAKMALQSMPLNVLLCNTRILRRDERRFVFEVISPSRETWILQGTNSLIYSR